MPYQAPLAPLLPLEFFRQIIGWDPWRFWGWSNDSTLLRTRTACDPVIMEYDWQQTDAPGRADIAEAIVTAETQLCDYLGFEVAPRYKQDILPWPRLSDRRMVRWGSTDADDRWLNIQLRDGFIQALGAEKLTLIASGVAVTLSDPDGDGLNELASLGPVTTTVTDPLQIAVYFSAPDRFDLDNAIGERWRVQPTLATISGGQVSIRGYGYTFMRPILREGYYDNQVIDPTDASNYAATVDIYQRAPATGADAVDVASSQGVVYWETRPYHGWWCQCGCGQPTYSGSIDDPAAVAQAAARVGVRNARTGNIVPAEAFYNTTDGTWASCGIFDFAEEPDRVLVRYLAGQPLGTDGFLDRKWRNIVARFAAAELKRNIVGCEEANRFLQYWQQDMSKVGNAVTELFSVSDRVTSNPFGTRRGHVYAWSMVMDLKLVLGAVAL